MVMVALIHPRLHTRTTQEALKDIHAHVPPPQTNKSESLEPGDLCHSKAPP